MKVKVFLPKKYDGEFNGIYDGQIYKIVEDPDVITAVEIMEQCIADPDYYLVEVGEGYAWADKNWCINVHKYDITISEDLF